MTESTAKILLYNQDIAITQTIKKFLSGKSYTILQVLDEQDVWETLNSLERRVDLIFINQIELCQKALKLIEALKASPMFNHLPIIVLVSTDQVEEIKAELNFGDLHFITEPINEETLSSLFHSAVWEHEHFIRLQDRIFKKKLGLNLLERARFTCQSLNEADNIATLIASICPDPENVVVGLSELLINSIEHGNLGISYEEKTKLLLIECWETEIEKRLANKKYRNKFTTIDIQNDEKHLQITIEDQGEGFDWHPYMNFDIKRAFDNHGRGIALAQKLSFDNLEYQGNGNIVVATLNK